MSAWMHRMRLVAPALAVLVAAGTASACPFCAGSGVEAIGTRMFLNDATVSAKVSKIATVIDAGIFRRQVTFDVLDVIVAQQVKLESRQFTTLAAGDEKEGEQRIVFLSKIGDGGFEVLDSRPDPNGELARYLAAVYAMGEKPSVPERIRFYATRFESTNPAIQEDAFTSFSFIRAEQIQANREALPLDKLRGWLADEQLPLSRRALYAFLVGIAANADDAKTLRGLLERFRGDCPPEGTAFFTGYALADPKAGLDYLQAALTDRTAHITFRTQAAYALRYLDGLVPRDHLRDRFRPILRRLLNDPDFAPDAIRTWRDLRDADALPDVLAWYPAAHDKLSTEVRLEVIRLASEMEGPRAEDLRAMVLRLDPDLVNASDLSPTSAPASQPASAPAAQP